MTRLATSFVRSSMTSVPVEVLLVVDPVRNLLALAIRLALGRAVSLDVDIDVDVDDLVRGEKAILDALLERVRVDGRAEVVDVGDVLRLLRRRRQADLRRAGEVLKDLSPSSVFVGASTVTLIDDDEVEEAGRELTEELLPLLRAGERLIQAEVDFVRGVDPPLLVDGRRDRGCRSIFGLDCLRARAQLRHRPLERTEVVDHRLVDEDVAVRQVEDPLLASRLPQPPDDLERRVGLPGARRHDEEDAVLPLRDGLGRSVDGVALVVPRLPTAPVIEVVLEDNLLDLGRQALPLLGSSATAFRGSGRH